MARIEIGKHLPADTRVCSGRLIFKGTRIMVSDVMELTEAEFSPEAIAKEYHGSSARRPSGRPGCSSSRALSRRLAARVGLSLDHP